MAHAKFISPVIARTAAGIGDYLSTWRRIEGITAREMAARVGVSVDTISRLEHGDTSVGFGTVLSVARIIGILPQLQDAFDPASTEYGRLQLAQHVPQRVRHHG